MARTTKPIIMPMLSELDFDSSVTMPPPNSTCRPASRAALGRGGELVAGGSSIWSDGTG
jgi:hypothetical protein